jgi:hypothetical protein
MLFGASGAAIMAPVERVATPGGPRKERETEMTFDEEKRG